VRTNSPEEQEYVLWVIRNRVESGRFGKGYQGVVLRPSQFSAFNAWTDPAAKHPDPEKVFALISKQEGHVALLSTVYLAEKVLRMPRHPERQEESLAPDNGLPPAVMHYYSPVSMKPPGSRPPWASSAKRLFAPPGIDPERFVFAEGVP
jgi:hypothetical protein